MRARAAIHKEWAPKDLEGALNASVVPKSERELRGAWG